MGKRTRRGSDRPTLFDLPLQSSGREPDPGPGEPSAEKGSGADTKASPVARRTGQGPSILFDGNEDTEGSKEAAPQLDLIELGTSQNASRIGQAELGIDQTELPGGRMRVAVTSDEEAVLGDRLLGGLADLAAQLIALGLAIAATHWIGIVVTVADWMPFGVLALVFSFLYWAVPLAFWGQTPGMAWVGHTAKSSSGEPLSFGQTFLRWLGSVLTLAVAGLPLLIALTGRSLTDRISGSRTTAG